MCSVDTYTNNVVVLVDNNKKHPDLFSMCIVISTVSGCVLSNSSFSGFIFKFESARFRSSRSGH